jgi:flagellar hook assembly protein FlgD
MRSAGLHPVSWDGRDDAGSRVASGIYYVRLVTGQGVRQQKIARVR